MTGKLPYWKYQYLFINYKLIQNCYKMLKTEQKLILLFLLAVIASCQKNLTLTCIPNCTTTLCASKTCINLFGTGINQTICTDENYTCVSTQPFNVTVNTCDYDYQSVACSRICFSTTGHSFAVLNSIETCATPINITYTCGPCTSIICQSGLCQVRSQNGVQKSTQCVNGCPSVSQINSTYHACTGHFDDLGTNSTCCTSFDPTPGPICSTQGVLSQSSKLTAWVKPPSNNTTTTFESNINRIIGIAIILCLSFLVL